MDPESELETALVDLGNRLQLQRRGHSPGVFRSAVEAWCKDLDWPPDVLQHALLLDRNNAAHIGRVVIKYNGVVREKKKKKSTLARGAYYVKKTGARVSPDLRTNLDDYIDASDEAMSKMESRDYLLIALAVAAAGYVIYRLTRRHATEAVLPSPRPVPQSDRWILVLVINASRLSVVDAVRDRSVGALDGDQLYQATQAIWFGRALDFDKSDLSRWFDSSNQVVEECEYDVHLVKIDLAEDDQGLHRKANQIDRLDAFRRFQAKTFNATVSARLPSDAYGTTDVYSR